MPPRYCEELQTRIKQGAEHCTDHYDITDLCKDNPKRLELLAEAGGGDIKNDSHNLGVRVLYYSFCWPRLRA